MNDFHATRDINERVNENFVLENFFRMYHLPTVYLRGVASNKVI